MNKEEILNKRTVSVPLRDKESEERKRQYLENMKRFQGNQSNRYPETVPMILKHSLMDKETWDNLKEWTEDTLKRYGTIEIPDCFESYDNIGTMVDMIGTLLDLGYDGEFLKEHTNFCNDLFLYVIEKGAIQENFKDQPQEHRYHPFTIRTKEGRMDFRMKNLLWGWAVYRDAHKEECEVAFERIKEKDGFEEEVEDEENYER